MKNRISSSFFPVFLVVILAACTKETTYVYQVNDVTLNQSGNNKTTAKTTTEFISIAYSDLFSTTISNSKLVELNTAYSSFGDKKLVEDRIIRQFLADTNLVIPTVAVMRSDINFFITKSYNRFFNRNPNDFEKNYMHNLIQNDTNITPKMMYYALMTSNEYRYY
jgi:general stress protein CsbA